MNSQSGLYFKIRQQKKLEQFRIKNIVAVQRQTQLIHKGVVYKRSKHMGIWRPRNTQLRQNYIFTYKQNDPIPTEMIELRSITVAQKDVQLQNQQHKNQFYIQGNDKHGQKAHFQFKCNRKQKCIKTLPYQGDVSIESQNGNFIQQSQFDKYLELNTDKMLFPIWNYKQNKYIQIHENDLQKDRVEQQEKRIEPL